MTIPMSRFPWLSHRTMAEVAETEALLGKWYSGYHLHTQADADRLTNLANRVPYRPDHVRRVVDFDEFWRRPQATGDAA